MAQTTINIYAADQIFNLATRLIGTFVGLIAGLVAWYIGNGNGNGNGNPYGAATGVGVVLIPIVFVRLFTPMQFAAGVILGCATFALIVGYSWVDGHIVQYATPGIGWTVAWKRFTLVVIGSGASFIIMMLPPTSGRKAVRIRNASIISSISRIYGFLISTWITPSTEEKKDIHPDSPEWMREFRKRLIALADEITTLRGLTEVARWEGSVRGAWPVDEYIRLVDVETEMIAGLAQLGSALGHLADDWRINFLHATKVLNPNFIADVMSIFSLVSQSLRTGEPMHQVLPSTLLERLFYHHPRNHGSTLNQEVMMTITDMQSLDYMYYATGLCAVYQLLQSLDDLQKITKRLCGEVPLKGFSDWRGEYDRVHMPEVVLG
jgi:hypothetical protein